MYRLTFLILPSYHDAFVQRAVVCGIRRAACGSVNNRFFEVGYVCSVDGDDGNGIDVGR